MLGSSTDSTTPRLTSKLAKQYAILVIVLGFGLVALCVTVDHIRPIDSRLSGRFGPRIWLYASPGTRIVYGGDNQIVTRNGAGTKIFNLPVKEVFKGQEQMWSPVVSGRWLAYVNGYQKMPRQIKVLNLETGEEIALGAGEPGQWSPAISGDWVVFEERSPNDNKVNNIYAYDLNKGVRQPIAIEGGKVRCCPKVSNQWVIYLQADAPWDSRRTAIELRAYSLMTGEDFAIGFVPAPNNASFGAFHALDNDKVAWIRPEPDYKTSAHLFDLTTREDHVLPSETGYLGDVSITDKQRLVVFNNNGWKVVDWSKSQPELVALPWSSSVDGLRAAGDYLVGRAARDLFVTQISP
jgi:hypothetical protein